MKYLKSLLIIILVSFAFSLSAQTVYITKTGKKYHKENCRYLHSSKIPISLSDAKTKGYLPCKVCKPNVNETKINSTNHNVVNLQGASNKSNTQTKAIKKVQCSAITKSGTRCKRMTTDPSGRCWQHRSE